MRLVTLLMILASCGETLPTDGQVEGQQLGEALLLEMARTLKLTAPHRCARWPAPTTGPVEIGPRSASLMDGTLVPEGFGADKLAIAVVADAREGSSAGFLRMKDELEQQGVGALISLGGHGEDAETIRAVLRALSDKAKYLVIALPGDREAIPAHREAIDGLVADGLAIVDGSRYRLIDLGPLVVATLPGLAMTANLVAGAEGCEHVAGDIQELGTRLQAMSKPTIVASYSPLRQVGIAGTDLGLGGIHVGEREMQSLLSQATVFVHGAVGEPSPKGKAKIGNPAPSLAAGSLEPRLGRSSALLLSADGKTVRWQPLRSK